MSMSLFLLPNLLSIRQEGPVTDGTPCPHTSKLVQNWLPWEITGHCIQVPPYRNLLAQCLEEPKLIGCIWGMAAGRTCCLQTSKEDPQERGHGQLEMHLIKAFALGHLEQDYPLLKRSEPAFWYRNSSPSLWEQRDWGNSVLGRHPPAEVLCPLPYTP